MTPKFFSQPLGGSFTRLTFKSVGEPDYIYLHYHPHHVPIPLSASRGKSGHVTMLPESCLSKQGVKKARTGITGWCSLTVRRLHSSWALSRSLVSMTLPPCPHFSRVFHPCHQSPCSLCHLHLWCCKPATPVLWKAPYFCPLGLLLRSGDLQKVSADKAPKIPSRAIFALSDAVWHRILVAGTERESPVGFTIPPFGKYPFSFTIRSVVSAIHKCYGCVIFAWYSIYTLVESWSYIAQN